MCKSAKLLNNSFEDEFEDTQNFAMLFHELNRAYIRIIKSLIPNKNPGNFGKNYKSNLLQEKEHLLQILRNQKNYLCQIESPKSIIDTKENEIKFLKDTIKKIQDLKPEKLILQLDERLTEILQEDLKLLTTDFITTSWTAIYPNSLNDILHYKHNLFQT